MSKDQQTKADTLKEKSLDEIIQQFDSDPDKGLTKKVIRQKREKYGWNSIEEENESWILRLLKNFWGPIPWMLEAACILSAVSGRWEDFGVIFFMLLINGGFSGYVGGNLLAIAVGALMSVQIGLMMGAAIKDIQTMFTVWKSGALILFAPAILFLFPGVPQWIARIFPTYYFLGPLYRMTIDAVPLRDVAVDLSIGVAISIALAVLAGASGAKMERRLAAQ